MTEKIEKYDRDYNIKKCAKCGEIEGWDIIYNKPTDTLIVRCEVCGYEYRMRPVDWDD